MFEQDLEEKVSVLDGVLFRLDLVCGGVFFKEKPQRFFRKSRRAQTCQKTRHKNKKKKTSHFGVSRLLSRLRF